METSRDVHSLINKKFSYLQYKGEKIQEGVKASEEVLESFYENMKCIDSEINWNSNKLTKKYVMGSKRVQEFYPKIK